MYATSKIGRPTENPAIVVSLCPRLVDEQPDRWAEKKAPHYIPSTFTLTFIYMVTNNCHRMCNSIPVTFVSFEREKYCKFGLAVKAHMRQFPNFLTFYGQFRNHDREASSHRATHTDLMCSNWQAE